MHRSVYLSHFLKQFIRNEAVFRNKYSLLFHHRNGSKFTFSPYSTEQNQIDVLRKSTNKKENVPTFESLLESVNFLTLSEEEAEKLLTSCANTLEDSRNEQCQQIFKNLLRHNKVNLKVLHAYINICTENGIKLDISEIIENTNCQGTSETYKLLLKNVCEKGDIGEAFKILDKMKTDSVPLDEFVFNNLTLAHAISGGLEAAERILNTMKIAQIIMTNNTKFAILRGVSRYSDHRNFHNAIKKYGFKLDEYQLLEIIHELAQNNVNWLPEINDLYTESNLSKEFRSFLTHKCTSLVQIQKAEAALAVFKHFLNILKEESGFFILEEMLHHNYDSKSILSSLTFLQEIEYNEYLPKQFTGVALKTHRTEISWAMLESLFSELRPHYFWSLLVKAYEKDGEVGVLQTVFKMKEMNVPFDHETWEYYVLPFCNLDEYDLLIPKLQKHGFLVKEVLSPLVSVLIKNMKIQEALRVCNSYKNKIFGDNLLHLTSVAWYSTRDHSSVVEFVQKYCESNDISRDLVGEFLTITLGLCQDHRDLQDFCIVLKEIKNKSLKIFSSSAESLKNTLRTKSDIPKDLIHTLHDHIYAIHDYQMLPDVAHIPHPKDMSIEDLECHLLELQEKNMNTRGTLRRLIMHFSNIGDTQKMQEYRNQFVEAKFEESIGMKSTIFYSFVKSGNYEAALNLYNEIKNIDENFIMDDFKVIDLATLLVKNDRTSEAWDIFQGEVKLRKKGRTKEIKRNCLELLKAFKDEHQQLKMFTFLVNNKYCELDNVMLGPLVRIHLTKGNLEKACETYITFTKKYKCTPLQLELIKAILLNQKEELLENIVKHTAQVHGKEPTKVALIAATAECEKVSILTNLLSQNTTSTDRLLKQRCEYWLKNEQSAALMALLSAYIKSKKGLNDVDYIVQALVRIYKSRGELQELSRLYEYLMDNEVESSTKVILDAIENIKGKQISRLK